MPAKRCTREGCPENVTGNVPGSADHCSVLCFHVDAIQKKLRFLLRQSKKDADRQAVLRTAWVASAELATAVDSLRELAVQRRTRSRG